MRGLTEREVNVQPSARALLCLLTLDPCSAAPAARVYIWVSVFKSAHVGWVVPSGFFAKHHRNYRGPIKAHAHTQSFHPLERVAWHHPLLKKDSSVLGSRMRSEV